MGSETQKQQQLDSALPVVKKTWPAKFDRALQKLKAWACHDSENPEGSIIRLRQKDNNFFVPQLQVEV